MLSDANHFQMQVHRVLTDDGVVVMGGLNRNLRTRLLLWWHTEYLQDWSPQLLDWRLGITPAELKAFCTDADLNLVHEELQGVCETTKYSMNWQALPAVLRAQHTGARACKSIEQHYLGWAYKAPSTHATNGMSDDDSVHEEL